MSLENFREFAPQVLQKEIQENPHKSAVELAADQLIDAGRMEITKLYDSVWDRRTDTAIVDENFVDKLFRKHSPDLGSILLGVGINTMHRALADGYFSPQEFYEYWNVQVRGFSHLTFAKIPEEPVEIFSPEKYSSMLSLAKEDKTLSDFFQSQNRDLRPNGYKNFLEQYKLIRHIRKATPVYLEVISQLLKPSVREESTDYSEKLSVFDGLINSLQQLHPNKEKLL